MVFSNFRVCCLDSQDLLFYGPLDKCRICNGKLEFNGIRYSCTGTYSEWASCTLNTRDPPRKQEPTNLPESVEKSPASDVITPLPIIFFIFEMLYHVHD